MIEKALNILVTTRKHKIGKVDKQTTNEKWKPKTSTKMTKWTQTYKLNKL